MARPFATPVECTCAMCGRTVSLPPSKAARFTTCHGYCRSTLNHSKQHWDNLLQRLAFGYIGRFDVETPGDPEDRARLATVDGQRFLFVRESGGWLKFSPARNLQGEEVFGGDRFETVVDAPPCELRTAQQRRLIEAHQEDTHG